MYTVKVLASAAYLLFSPFFLACVTAQLGEANGGYFVDTISYDTPAVQFSVGQTAPIYYFTNFLYYSLQLTQTDVDPPQSAFIFSSSPPYPAFPFSASSIETLAHCETANRSSNPPESNILYNWTVSLDVADTTFSLHPNGSGSSGTFYMAIFNATNGPSNYGFQSTTFTVTSNFSDASSTMTSSAASTFPTGTAPISQSSATSNFSSTTDTGAGVVPTAAPNATQTLTPFATGLGTSRHADLRTGLGFGGFVVLGAVSWFWLRG